MDGRDGTVRQCQPSVRNQSTVNCRLDSIYSTLWADFDCTHLEFHSVVLKALCFGCWCLERTHRSAAESVLWVWGFEFGEMWRFYGDRSVTDIGDTVVSTDWLTSSVAFWIQWIDFPNLFGNERYFVVEIGLWYWLQKGWWDFGLD